MHVLLYIISIVLFILLLVVLEFLWEFIMKVIGLVLMVAGIVGGLGGAIYYLIIAFQTDDVSQLFQVVGVIIGGLIVAIIGVGLLSETS